MLQYEFLVPSGVLQLVQQIAVGIRRRLLTPVFDGRYRITGGARQGPAKHVPRLERDVPRRTNWVKINRVNSKIKLLKSPENNLDIDVRVLINPKYNIKIRNRFSK